MSRWLSSVTNYLEQLDDQAEDYVEENINVNQEASGDADAHLDSILAQRGLQPAPSTEDDDLDDALAAMEHAADGAPGDNPVTVEGSSQAPAPHAEETTTSPEEETPESETPQVDEGQSEQPSLEESDKKEDSDKANVTTTKTESPKDFIEEPDSKYQEEKEEVSTDDTMDASSRKPADENTQEARASEKEKNLSNDTASTNQGVTPPLPPPPPPPAAKAEAPKGAAVKVETKKAPPPPPSAPKNKQAPPPPKAPPAPKSAPSTTPAVKDPNPALVKEARESQKEVRTLRRHVVALNKQLESVEAEVSAQRDELEQAGGRMEKDRAKAKLERDNERKRHAEEHKAMQAQHEKTLMDEKTRMEQQCARLEQRMAGMEQTRMQEGGNWDKELQGAVEREQVFGQKMAALEDEKATFLAQINTLQSQQEALGDRIESLSQTADSAMEREREAEERLDQALSVHSHQISQRQNRERELERQISEMGSAMASLRSKESSRLSDYSKGASETSDTAGENTSQDSSLRMRLDMALHDLETSQANMDLERQRTEALQRELKDISNERTEESANARMKQNKHDRQIAELTLQVSRMQQQPSIEASSSRDMNESSRNVAEVHDLQVQIKELSEEILKSREKAGGYSSELATVKSRLRGANDRADKAEIALEEARTVESTDSYDRMERAAPQSGSSMRRRGARPVTTSISSAMHLNKTEKVGKAVDALDSFSVSTGKYLRVNPVARAVFIMYLMVLHLWTFVIIFFHAHNFEDMHRTGIDLPHGPDAIMQKQLGAGGQAMAAAVASAKAAAAAKTP